MEAKLPYRKRPCGDCPFRKDSFSLKSLGDKMEKIIRSDVHTCHKTQGLSDAKKLQCAGHMLLHGDNNMFVRTARQLGIPIELSGRELVFDTPDSALYHHHT